MSKSYKFWTGVIAILPLIMTGLYVIFFILFMMKLIRNEAQEVATPPLHDMMAMFAILGVMAIAGLGALVFFLVHIINNKKLEETERIVWILMFLFASVLAFPVYWYMKILKKSSNPVAEHQDFSSQTFTR